MTPISSTIIRISFLAIALLALAACSANRPSPGATVNSVSSADSTAATPPFAELREEWAADLRAKRINASLDRYTDDADFLQPDGARVHGATALKTLFQQVTAQFDSDLRFTSRTTQFSNTLAYDSGTYQETLTVRATGKKLDATGDYLTVYRRSPDGRWRIAAQAWTTTH